MPKPVTDASTHVTSTLGLRRVAVLTSGGDAPGMNSAIRALAKIASARGVECVGVELGYEGLIAGTMRPLNVREGGELRPTSEIELMGGEGGTLLGSARSAHFREVDGRARAAAQLSDIDGLVVIGGNGSLTGAHVLAEEHGVRVVGIPASIDNDIGCTSFAIGVDTALNTIVDACDRISDTARAHRRAFVVEVMGRDCGYLAMASAIACAADAVLMREQGRGDQEVIVAVEAAVRRGFARGKQRVLVIKSEGVSVPCTLLVRELNTRIDGDLVRATVLGHLVRGGRPSFQDRRIASRMALQALLALEQGKTDVMTSWQSSEGDPTRDPSVRCVPLPLVLEETRSILDGTNAAMRWRLKMMEEVEGVLGL